MQEQQVSSPVIQVTGSEGAANGECPRHVAKAKRKARSTRRRLNAMINNTSLHFSDTDSEGELATPRNTTPNHHHANDANLLRPVISVTLDPSDDSSCAAGRRNSYLENLTDVDEIYTSDVENNEPTGRATSPRGSLAVEVDNAQQGETDLEEMSNEEDEESVQPPILVKRRSDILCDFNGEMITTKEGDGPFSVEIRNQMSVDESSGPACETPDLPGLAVPATDTEDMEASDEDGEEATCGLRAVYEGFDLIAASQIVMTNVDKMEPQLLTVRGDVEDAISESHTDVEDIE
ncbi:uncharacterized protein LOC106645469 [Copidosoma floridanum]|uniref:uncharacterized protein LOC106645469 n=1 Tax=Copidosoma floridanum TaxID=29053 RepID=UPI0006C98930|nr:uncharacterized protein LOC106645469 [Copidosoma floridanum]